MTARTVADTRGRLLDEAIRHFLDDSHVVSVNEVRLRDVAERVGLTTGAAYRCWENQEAFRHDLTIALIQWRERGSIDLTVEAIRTLVKDGGAWTDMVRMGADSALHDFEADREFLAVASLRTSVSRNEELSLLARRYHEEALASYRELYTGLLGYYGRRMKAPFTVDHLASSLAAIAEGFDVQAMKRVHHPRVAWSPGAACGADDWSLLGVASVALIERMTEPGTATDACGSAGSLSSNDSDE